MRSKAFPVKQELCIRSTVSPKTPKCSDAGHLEGDWIMGCCIQKQTEPLRRPQLSVLLGGEHGWG